MSAHSTDGPQLNASQRRSVEALLESVEAVLVQVERLLPDSGGHENGITLVSNDLPEPFAAAAPARIEHVRTQVRQLAERIDLSRRRVSKRRTVRGMLSAQLMRVEDVTPARLSGYGELHPSFKEEISPALKQIQGSLKDLLDLLHD